MASKNIEMIQLVASGLSDLNNDVVYVGGAVTELYANQVIAEDIRVTEDVDVIVQIQSQHDYRELEEKLRKKGFHNDTSEDAPICRWIYKNVKLDLMPDDSNILGFSNKWYKPGIKNKIPLTLETGDTIFILPVHYYLATKLEAALGRGISDLRISHDFEDVVYILDNNEDVNSLPKGLGKRLIKYLVESLKQLSQMDVFEEAIEYSLPYGAQDRAELIKDRINNIIQTSY